VNIVRRCCVYWRDRSGATAVEFAYVVGPLLLLLVGVIEVGRLMWTSHALDELAIDAARCIGIRASGCATPDQIRPDLVANYVGEAARSWGVVVAAQDISLSTNTGCAVDTGFLRVGLTHSFQSVLPGIGNTQLDSEACFPSQFPDSDS